METREELERNALKSVCACYYYDMANDIEIISDEDLRATIEDPQYPHKQRQRFDPSSEEQYLRDLEECPEHSL